MQRASDTESQLTEEQGKVMKLEVTLAEQQQKLGRMEDLEKELNHHRYSCCTHVSMLPDHDLLPDMSCACRKVSKEVDAGPKKGGGGIWNYIAGTPAT